MKRLVLIMTLCLLTLVVVGGYFWWTSSSVSGGFSEKVIVGLNGHTQKYIIFIPHGYKPGQKRPLLLVLPHQATALHALRKYFGLPVSEIKRTFPFVIVIPQCSKDGGWRRYIGWNETQIDKALYIMDQVAKDYATDPDRVYVTGVSAGGQGVWNIIGLHPDRFAAAVPQCGMPCGATEKIADAHVQIWNFYNTGDTAELLESNRTMHQSLRDAGASPLLTEFEQPGHGGSALTYRCVGMYSWLLDQSRSKNARQTQLFEPLSAKQMLATWESCGANGWRVDKDGSLSYKALHSKQPGYLVSKKSYDACEFHFDVFLESEASACRLGLFDVVNNDVISGYTLTLLSTNMGTCDLVHSANGWIASADPAAQHQLHVGWNDIRVHFGNGRISVRINGWKAMDVLMQENDEKPLRVAIISPDIKAGVRWRNARLRVPD